MPHSIRGSADSQSTYSFDLARSMNRPASGTAFLHNRSGLAPANGSKRDSTQSIQSNSSKRDSLAAAKAYVDLIGKGEVDEFLQKHLGDRNSMIATYNNTSKHRTQFYDDQFQPKENAGSNVRDRVQRESPVVAELRTNVIIKDEFTLVTDLSYHLAARYTRPDSSIMVKVDHSACLALGGTFDPCYILSITTVPSQMGPTMNKRNAALIQSFMADILSVPPDRGIVKFEPIPEENFAINGTTMLGEVERQEKQQSGENGGAAPLRRAVSNGGKRLPFKRSFSNLQTEPKIVESRSPEREAETPKKAGANDLGGWSEALEEAKKRRASVDPASFSSPTGVYELPAVEMNTPRPSTSHGPGSSHGHSASNGSNGLRMNGISDSNLEAKAKSAQRPKSFSAATGSNAKSLQTQIKAQGMTATVLPNGLAKRDRPPSFLKTDPSKSGTKLRSKKTISSPIPAQIDTNKMRPSDSYLDGIMGKPLALKTFGGEPTIMEKPSKELTETSKEKEKDEPTANTAKRRSTLTAVPKIPEVPASKPAPPEEPKSGDGKSVKSMKVSKRKSILSAFRKSAGR